MPAKRKTLPKDFDGMLRSGSADALRAVFDVCQVDARGGLSKQVALAFEDCPDDLARWLVANGADLSAEDAYGETPLHARSGCWHGRIETLLALGADVRNGEGKPRGTPLHRAASACIPANASLLVAAGAPMEALDRDDLTPLELALRRCTNSTIDRMADLALVMLGAGAARTPRMRDWIVRIGTNFEFHRATYNPDEVDATSEALDKLYALFDVAPVARRAMHDGISPIAATRDRWEDSYEELWTALVPSRGAAATVQGEVIRIPGKLEDEILRNGGGNWGAGHRAMVDAWLVLVGTGAALPPEVMAEAERIAGSVRLGDGNTERMRELSVAWVALNPVPAPLGSPRYSI